MIPVVWLWHDSRLEEKDLDYQNTVCVDDNGLDGDLNTQHLDAVVLCVCVYVS